MKIYTVKEKTRDKLFAWKLVAQREREKKIEVCDGKSLACLTI